MMRWSPALRRLDWLVARPIAHRGLHDEQHGVIENTASAFAAAIASNYSIECDLLLSGDGEAVVFHDEAVDRLMDGRGAVAGLSVTELKRLRFKAGRDRIQTLGEMLDQVSGRASLVIELKSRWNGDERLLARALQILAPYSGPYALMSFDPDLVTALRERSPQTARGIVADRGTDDHYRILPVWRRIELQRFSHAAMSQPHFVSFDWAGFPFAPVSAFRARGGPVICWTIRSAEAAAVARRYSDQITFEGFAA
jgi:glycerophosphoryl diester phosphodiesterase